MKAARVLMHNKFAGLLLEDENGHHFKYQEEYLQSKKAEPVSLTLPLQAEEFHSQVLFPFFDGLVPEEWLLHIAEKIWKINPRDRMSLLMVACRDCIGAVWKNKKAYDFIFSPYYYPSNISYEAIQGLPRRIVTTIER